MSKSKMAMEKGSVAAQSSVRVNFRCWRPFCGQKTQMELFLFLRTVWCGQFKD